MKILYFISVLGHGRGGHFHSLNHISAKIGEEHNIKIISIGPGESEVVESNPFFYKHINFNGLNFLQLRTVINAIRKSFNPDIFHCFDINSYNLIRLFISTKYNVLIVNKCGGPNSLNYPFIPNLILFSKENFDFFNIQKKYQESTLNLIPNRVLPVQIEENNLIQKDPSIFTFVRICRIGRSYHKSLIDSITLIENLILHNVKNVRLIVIGTIEDENVYKFLCQHKLVQEKKIVILINEVYTKEASKMLYLADAVIGTGRNLMESASLGIPILTINSKDNIPILLNESNFQDAFKTNFSERNEFDNYHEKINLQAIIRAVEDPEYYQKLCLFSKEVFDKYFSLQTVKEAYPDIYRKAIYSDKKIIEDKRSIIRSFFSFKNHKWKAI